MATSNTNITDYGTLMGEIDNHLTDLQSAIPTHEMVENYLAGLSQKFDHIRFIMQDKIDTNPFHYTTVCDATNEVEMWAGSLPKLRQRHVRSVLGNQHHYSTHAFE